MIWEKIIVQLAEKNLFENELKSLIQKTVWIKKKKSAKFNKHTKSSIIKKELKIK